ncbi:unnamed protein product, partial [Rangifer tarandus platyrhynchus]
QDLNTRELAAPALSSRPPALVTLSLCVPPLLVFCSTGTLYGESLWKTLEPMPRCAAPPLGLS